MAHVAVNVRDGRPRGAHEVGEGAAERRGVGLIVLQEEEVLQAGGGVGEKKDG